MMPFRLQANPSSFSARRWAGLERAKGCSRRRFLSRAAADMGSMDEDEEALKIFYGQGIPMAELGLNAALVKAMGSMGVTKSTAIQGAAIPKILTSDTTVVMGAETGSGKTLAYLLPVLNKILGTRASSQPAGEESEITTTEEGESKGDTPVRATEEGYGDEEMQSAALSSSPYSSPPSKQRQWQMYPHAVVLTPNRDLCEQAARMAREVAEALATSSSDDSGGSADALRVFSVHGSERDWPFRPNLPAPDILVCTPKMLRQHVRDLDLFAEIETLVIDEADMLLDRGGYENDINEILVAFKRANRTLEYNKRTQVILSAATIPTMGLKSMEKFIEKRFRDAIHIRADLMHKHHPSTKQVFFKTETADIEERAELIFEAIQDESEKYPKTIVFANSARDAQSIAMKRACVYSIAEELMERFEDPSLVFPYHKDVPSYERDTVIENFRNTIGRATRAGRAGRATNFYDESNQDLVDAIQDAGEDSLDHSFSRRRGFRKTVKRYGKKFYKGGKKPQGSMRKSEE
eukprot:jgi/Bigna1/145584/aug1.101_g20292